MAGVVIEAVLKELQPGGAFLDDLGPRLGSDLHIVVGTGVGLALVGPRLPAKCFHQIPLPLVLIDRRYLFIGFVLKDLIINLRPQA